MDVEILKDIYEKYPQMKMPIEVMKNTQITYATAGPLTDHYQEFRNTIRDALQNVLTKGETPEKALDDAAKKMTEILNR